jgi:hypothetical protein
MFVNRNDSVDLKCGCAVRDSGKHMNWRTLSSSLFGIRNRNKLLLTY